MSDEHTFCDSDCAYRWCAWHRSHIHLGWTAVGRDLRCAHYQKPGASLSALIRSHCPAKPSTDSGDTQK